LEFRTEDERNGFYNSLICLLGRCNDKFSAEALSMVKIQSDQAKRKRNLVTNSNGEKTEKEKDNNNLKSKKPVQPNKLNHSTLNTLETMGAFSKGTNLEKLIEEENDDHAGSEERSQSQLNLNDKESGTGFDEDGRESIAKKSVRGGSVVDEQSSEFGEGRETFSHRVSSTFTSGPPKQGLKREQSAQIVDFGDIYHSRSMGSREIDETLSPSRPESRKSNFDLQSNPLTAQRNSITGGDEDSAPPRRSSITSRTSLTGGDGRVRRTSVTMAGLANQQPINTKGRRKSVVK
jgi:hypothetical protein